MKTALFILFLAAKSFAASFVWNPMPSTNVASYVLLWGTNSGSYLWSTNTGNATNFTVPDSVFPIGTNFFSITALNASGDEIGVGTSELVFVRWPANLRVKLSMDSAPSPTGPWTETITITNSVAVQDTAYFRGRLDIQPSSRIP